MAPLLVTAGGGIGALLRWWLQVSITSHWGTPRGFPLAIFLVNITGCFLFGLLAGWSRSKGDLMFLFIHTGILGGYTTFSTFGADTLQLIEARQPGMAALNAAGSVIAGVLAVWAGMMLGKQTPS